MIDEYPLGRKGPTLDKILSIDSDKPKVVDPKVVDSKVVDSKVVKVASLIEKLNILFPNCEKRIKDLIDKNPKELDIHFFINQLLEIPHDKNIDNKKQSQASAMLDTEDDGTELYELYLKKENEKKKSKRSPAKSQEFYNKLIAIFPNNINEIQETLNRYPCEDWIEMIIDKLMRRIF